MKILKLLFAFLVGDAITLPLMQWAKSLYPDSQSAVRGITLAEQVLLVTGILGFFTFIAIVVKQMFGPNE